MAIMMMRAMRRRRVAQSQLSRSDGVDDGIDHIEDRLGRPEARGDRQVSEFTRALLIAEEVIARLKCRCPLLECFLRVLELSWVRSLEAVDRLLEIADHEQCAASALALA